MQFKQFIQFNTFEQKYPVKIEKHYKQNYCLYIQDTLKTFQMTSFQLECLDFVKKEYLQECVYRFAYTNDTVDDILDDFI